jgi:RNA polymerase sigma-70 factor (ECF subfamily)
MDELPTNSESATEDFLRLLGQHERHLAAFIYSLVPRAADADDILQDVKVTMWREFSKFTPGTNFRAWARQIATHQVLNFRRAIQRRPNPALEDSFIEAVAAEIDQQADEMDRRSDALQYCLQKLSEAHRKIIVWRYFDNCGIDEIATRSQRSSEAVYQLLSRIRGLLNDCVSRQLAAQV